LAIVPLVDATIRKSEYSILAGIQCAASHRFLAAYVGPVKHARPAVTSASVEQRIAKICIATIQENQKKIDPTPGVYTAQSPILSSAHVAAVA
jgi:hypothetical protein